MAFRIWRTTLPYFVNLIMWCLLPTCISSHIQTKLCALLVFPARWVRVVCYTAGVYRHAVQTFAVALRQADCVHVAYRQVLLVSAGSLTWRRNWQWTPKGRRRLANTPDGQRKEGQPVVSREVLTSRAVADYSLAHSLYCSYTWMLLWLPRSITYGLSTYLSDY